MITCRCGTPFTPKRSWQKHCSPACRKAAFQEGHGEITSVRMTKRGWSVTAYFERQPDLETGSIVTVMRSGRISEAVLSVVEKEVA